MKYITVATHNKGYLDVLKYAFQFNGETLNILGYNEKWRGFTWKYKLMYKFIENLPDDEIVVFMDGYDVLLLSTKNLYSNFKSFNKNIVFGIDNHNKYTKALYNRVFHNSFIKPKNAIDINSGLYMGYVKYLKLLLEKICINDVCNDPKMDDQKLIIKLSKTNFFKENIGIDYENKIFFNMSPKNLFTYKSDFKLINNKVINKNNEPNFVHGPGNTNMDFIVEAYGYKNTKKDRKKYMINAIKTYYMYLIPEFIIILLIFFLIIIMKKLCKI